jgi:hypothetical protein
MDNEIINDDIFCKILAEAVNIKGTIETQTVLIGVSRFCVNNTDGIPIAILEYEIKDNSIIITDRLFFEEKQFDLSDPKVFDEIREFIFPYISEYLSRYQSNKEESKLEIE